MSAWCPINSYIRPVRPVCVKSYLHGFGTLWPHELFVVFLQMNSQCYHGEKHTWEFIHIALDVDVQICLAYMGWGR